MKQTRKRISRLLSLALCLAMALSPVSEARAAEGPASSTNINAQDYTTYGQTVKSYLYANASGGLTRVEYISGSIVVEDYDSSFSLTASRTLPMALPIWGGFFAGADANYLIFGQENMGENSSQEVMRIVKYSKDWQKQGETSVRGAYTQIPFEAGSLRCAEYGGYLYIHAARQMFRNVMTMYGMMDTGTNHQANLTLEIRESDMTLVDLYDQVWNLDFGYVSHSFNQFILIDQDQNIVTLDHSDSNSDAGGRANYGYARPVTSRGVDLIRYDEKAGQDHFQGKNRDQQYQWCDFSLVQGFGGSSGNNVTGASIGGFAETSGGYVSAYNYDGTGGSGARSVYLGYTTKSGLSSSAKKISTAAGTTTPVLAPTGLGGGYILWNGKDGNTPNSTLYYASYSDGGTVGQVQTATAPLSDCQPVSYNGRMVWYVTNGSAPTFYGLDASGVTVLGGADPGSQSAPSTPSGPSDTTSSSTTPDPDTTTKPSDTTATTSPTGPSTENDPAFAVPSGATYRAGSFSWTDAAHQTEQIDFSFCTPRQEVTASVYLPDGTKQSVGTSLANVAYGSTVQRVKAGTSPNYGEQVTLYLATVTFPQQYAANVQISNETLTVKTGDTLKGPVNGYNALAMKQSAGMGGAYSAIFYLESESETPASVKAQTTPASTQTPSDTTSTTTPSSDKLTVDLMLAPPTFSYNTALKADGTVWKSNLPDSTYTQLDNVKSRSVDENFRVAEDGSLWVWGLGMYASIGDTIASPLKIMDNVAYASLGILFEQIALKEDGTLVGWSDDITPANAVKLMDNVVQIYNDDISWIALKNDGTLWQGGSISDPDDIKKIGEGFAAFSSNGRTFLGIRKDGSLWGWGANSLCQLGQGSATGEDQGWGIVSGLVKIMDDVVYASVYCDSCYAVTSDGTLYVWGANESGQLGFSGGTIKLENSYGEMVDCQGTPKAIMQDVAAVHNGVVLKKDGSLWAQEYGSASNYVSTGFKKVLDNVMLPTALPSFGTASSDSTTNTAADPSTTTTTPSTSENKPSVSFSDVKTTHWAYSDIAECAALGIVAGFGDGSFRPNDYVTDTQFITMLTRTFYSEELGRVSTPSGEKWYYPNLKVADDVNMSDGLSITNSNMTRYDMALTLYNIILHEEKSGSVTAAALSAARDSIGDYSRVPARYTDATAYCYALGILGGINGSFCGEQNMTRAQACTVIMRMLKLIDPASVG